MPSTNALPLSCSAPDTISAALAVPSFTKAMIGHIGSSPSSFATLEKYVSVIFQKEEDIEEGKELRASTIEKIEYLFENGKGHELGSGTVWNAYNAVTEYLTWEKGRTTDNRLHSLWFGADVNTNQKAFDAALQIANSI